MVKEKPCKNYLLIECVVLIGCEEFEELLVVVDIVGGWIFVRLVLAAKFQESSHWCWNMLRIDHRSW